MVLSQLLPKLRVLRRIENDPDVLIIHCGANSLGLIELKSLLEKLQDTLEQIAKLFPRSKLYGQTCSQDSIGGIQRTLGPWRTQEKESIGKQYC